MLDQDKCWEAVQKRDRSRDDTFFYGVLTTACTAGRLAHPVGLFARMCAFTNRRQKRNEMAFAPA